MRYVFVCENRDSIHVTAQDFADMIAAAALQQAEDFAPTWGVEPAAVIATFAENLGQPIDGKMVPVALRVTNGTDPDGAIAYHWVDPTTKEPAIVVLTDVVASMSAGSSSSTFLDNLAVAVTHEICECREDLFSDEWAELPDGRLEAKEACDRVQSASYGKTVKRIDGSTAVVQVTDFLTPDGFALVPTGEKADFMDVLPRATPRAVLPDKGDGKGGGYAIVRNADGSETQVDGDRRAALRYSHGALAHRGVDIPRVRAMLAASPK